MHVHSMCDRKWQCTAAHATLKSDNQLVCEKMRPHLSKHAEEGIALDPVQRHGN